MEMGDTSMSDGIGRALETQFLPRRPLKSGLRHWPQPRQMYLHLLQPNTNSFGRTAGIAAGFLSVALAAAGFLSVALAAGGFFLSVALAAAGFVAVALAAAGLLSVAFGWPDVESAGNFDCIKAWGLQPLAGSLKLEALPRCHR